MQRWARPGRGQVPRRSRVDVTADEPKSQTTTVQAIRGLVARTIVKWEASGWEVVGESRGSRRTELRLRKLRPQVSRRTIIIGPGAAPDGEQPTDTALGVPHAGRSPSRRGGGGTMGRRSAVASGASAGETRVAPEGEGRPQALRGAPSHDRRPALCRASGGTPRDERGVARVRRRTSMRGYPLTTKRLAPPRGATLTCRVSARSAPRSALRSRRAAASSTRARCRAAAAGTSGGRRTRAAPCRGRRSRGRRPT